MLAARAKALGSGEWVYAIGGWSVDQFANTRKRFTRAELDRIVPGNPYLNVTDEELRRGLEVSWNNKRPTASPGIGKLIDLVSSTDCPRFVRRQVQKVVAGARNRHYLQLWRLAP